MNELENISKFKGLISDTVDFFKTVPEQISVEPVHHFAGGMYCRELTMPKDTLWISKVHKRQGFGIIIKGDVSVISQRGTVRYKAPCMVVTEPGTQRALHIHEETTWLAVTTLPEGMTENTPIEEVENYMVCDNLDEYEQFLLENGGTKCLTQQ